MPRPKRVMSRTRKEIPIRTELLATIEMALYSELEGRVPYEAWSTLIEELLERWVKGQQRIARKES